jgi:CheY-like chemotaxis protein
MSASDQLLIASDALADANLVKQLLADEFSNVEISTDPTLAASDFAGQQPRVLILAFKSITKSEDYYLGLYRNAPLVHARPHRTVLLCSKDDVRRAYELCKGGRFDDYVHFWPISFDAPRLHMAIHGALRDLERTATDARRSDDLLVHAKTMSQLGAHVGQFVAKGTHQLDVADDSLKSAEISILAALDAFSRKLSVRRSGRSGESDDSGDVEREIQRVKTEEVENRLASVAGAMQSVRQWSSTISEDLAPQIAAVKALQVIADEIPPHILVVEDDLFQHKLLQRILGDLHATVVFAKSGAEALATLQKHRPDLILMDFNLPDMRGVDITRQIKAVDRYSAVPVIMVTGRQERSVVLECKAAGAVDFIVKPFERDTMLSKIRHWLQVTGPARATQPRIGSG